MKKEILDSIYSQFNEETPTTFLKVGLDKMAAAALKEGDKKIGFLFNELSLDRAKKALANGDTLFLEPGKPLTSADPFVQKVVEMYFNPQNKGQFPNLRKLFSTSSEESIKSFLAAITSKYLQYRRVQ